MRKGTYGESMGRRSADTHRLGRAIIWSIPVILWGTACNTPQKKITLQAQIAQEIKPITERLEQQQRTAAAAHKGHVGQISGLQRDLAAERKTIVELRADLDVARATLKGYEGMDARKIFTTLNGLDDELKSLDGKHVALVNKTTQQFDTNARERAALQQTDADLRQHTDAAVDGLDRSSTKARTALRSELVSRFEDDRSVVLSGFRELEDQVGAGTSRVAVALQLIREYLNLEQQAITSHERRLREVVSEIDTQFADGGGQERDQAAAKFFDEARRLNREFLGNPGATSKALDAVLSYRKGLALRPDAVDAHYDLGKLLTSLRRNEEARSHLQYYLKHGQDRERITEVKKWFGRS